MVFSNTNVLASAGGFSGSVIRSNSDVHSPVTVQLSSSDTTALTVPTEVVIPAGESFVNFMVTPVAGFRNPVRTVSITSTNVAYQSNPGVLSVDDGLPKPWRNSPSVFDINSDSHITAMDALLVINHLNSLGSHLLGTPG
ncbi:MAG: hypothetical protein IT423_07860, partial [Pirellulaceae bacterium]|nr:hypothetical protein [Pirellulaceae bacterium]